MNTLLHICCAPCSIMAIDSLRAEGFDPTGFWYNPNIHPYTEYAARRDALQAYAGEIALPLEMRDESGLRRFVEGVSLDFDRRCGFCYELRAEAAAAHAAARGFDSFTTTLLISPYQDHAKILDAMKRGADRHGVRFLDRDFRPLFREGQRRARDMELYMQKYCGCVFSEEERYLRRQKPAR